MLYNLLLLMVMFCHNCYSDNNINYFKPQLQTIFQKTPKVWQKYIRIFIHRYIKENKCKTFKLNLFKFLKYSLIFLSLKDKSWDSNGHSSGPTNRTGELIEKKKKKGANWRRAKGIIHNSNIIWPSGKIHITVLQNHKFVYFYHLYFSLNPKLRLNVTIISLVLHNLGTKCDYDKLEIKPQGKITSIYRYCGKHSRFNVYPLFSRLTINLILESKNDIKLKTVFSVTDKYLIFSLVDSLPRLSERNVSIQSQYYKIGSKYYMASFLLRATKLHKVKLDFVKSEENNSVIFDGPGIMFKVLNIAGKKSPYITSTFQCLLQFLLTYLIESYSLYFKFYLVQHVKYVHKKLKPDVEMLLKMPFNNCPHNTCVLHLESTTGHQINFTVLSVIANSSESSTCLFDGITIGELSNHFLTLVDFCPHFGAPANQLMRSFYTKNHNLWIVLYWYEGYSTISATITATSTKCKGVHLDTCYFNTCRAKTKTDSCYPFFERMRTSLKRGCAVIMVKDWEGLDIHNSPLWNSGACHMAIRSEVFEISHVCGKLLRGSFIMAVSNIPHAFKRKSFDPVREISLVGDKNYEIIYLHLSLSWPNRLNDWINIVLHGLKDKAMDSMIKTKHILSAALDGLFIGRLHKSKYMEGSDKILRIHTNIALNTRNKNVLCHIRSERRILRKVFPHSISFISKLIFKNNVLVCDVVLKISCHNKSTEFSLNKCSSAGHFCLGHSVLQIPVGHGKVLLQIKWKFKLNNTL